MDSTLVWYQVAFKNYLRLFSDDALPSKATLQQLVVALRNRGVRPITCNTYVTAGFHLQRALLFNAAGYNLRSQRALAADAS